MAGMIDIINRALTKLGERRIVSLDDNTKAAGTANSLYETVRDSEIAGHRWGFAVFRVMLPELAETPAFGSGHVYTMPSDCLRILEAGPWPIPVLADYIPASCQSWTIEGGNIITSQTPPLGLLYLKRITDAAFYPPVFAEALACKLAIEMAEELTGSNSKREIAWKEYEAALLRAKRWGAIQLPPQNIQDDTWVLARM